VAKKILLADDSVTMRKVFEMTFAAEDVTITAVASGAEAISRAREMKPDVVVADLSMPGKNGYDVCAELKADPALSGIPVLILHGSSAGFDQAKADAVKAAGAIAKPFETQALIEKLEELTAGRGLVESLAHEPMGPITSLSSPIEAADEDILIDTEEAPAQPVAPPPAARPGPPPPPPAKAKAPPPATVPAAPPPKPPAFLSAPPKPAAPPEPPPKAAEPSTEVEIEMEAEPPVAGSGAMELPSFDAPLPPRPAPAPAPVPSAPVIEPVREPRPAATILGLGRPEIPPPPAGLPSPPVGLPLPRSGLPLPPSGLPLPGALPAKAQPAPPLAVPVAPAPAPPPPASALAELKAPAIPAVDDAAATAPRIERPAPEKAAPPLAPAPKPAAVPSAAAPKPTAPASVGEPVTPLPPLEPGKPYDPVAMDAIARLSREIIERIVWEVVPDLAEKIIREELDRLVEGRRAR
jgi:CheY-like chemotaxis protein